jgi:WD40 repeat protein
LRKFRSPLSSSALLFRMSVIAANDPRRELEDFLVWVKGSLDLFRPHFLRLAFPLWAHTVLDYLVSPVAYQDASTSAAALGSVALKRHEQAAAALGLIGEQSTAIKSKQQVDAARYLLETYRHLFEPQHVVYTNALALVLPVRLNPSEVVSAVMEGKGSAEEGLPSDPAERRAAARGVIFSAAARTVKSNYALYDSNDKSLEAHLHAPYSGTLGGKFSYSELGNSAPSAVLGPAPSEELLHQEAANRLAASGDLQLLYRMSSPIYRFQVASMPSVCMRMVMDWLCKRNALYLLALLNERITVVETDATPDAASAATTAAMGALLSTAGGGATLGSALLIKASSAAGGGGTGSAVNSRLIAEEEERERRIFAAAFGGIDTGVANPAALPVPVEDALAGSARAVERAKARDSQDSSTLALFAPSSAGTTASSTSEVRWGVLSSVVYSPAITTVEPAAVAPVPTASAGAAGSASAAPSSASATFSSFPSSTSVVAAPARALIASFPGSDTTSTSSIPFADYAGSRYALAIAKAVAQQAKRAASSSHSKQHHHRIPLHLVSSTPDAYSAGAVIAANNAIASGTSTAGTTVSGTKRTHSEMAAGTSSSSAASSSIVAAAVAQSLFRAASNGSRLGGIVSVSLATTTSSSSSTSSGSSINAQCAAVAFPVVEPGLSPLYRQQQLQQAAAEQQQQQGPGGKNSKKRGGNDDEKGSASSSSSSASGATAGGDKRTGGAVAASSTSSDSSSSSSSSRHHTCFEPSLVQLAASEEQDTVSVNTGLVKLVAAGFSDGLIRLWATCRIGYTSSSSATNSSSVAPPRFVVETFAFESSQVDAITAGSITAIAISSCKRHVLAGTATGKVLLFSAEGLIEEAVRNAASALQRSHQGAVIVYPPIASDAASSSAAAAKSTDNNTLILSAVYKSPQGDRLPIWSVAFNPLTPNVFLVGGRDTTAQLWSTAFKQPQITFAGHVGDVESVCFHPNGLYAATASSDGSLRLWDCATGDCVRAFVATGSPSAAGSASAGLNAIVSSRITTCSFSPSGRYLASGDDNGSVLLWDISTGSCVLNLRGHGFMVPIKGLSFNAHGTLLSSCDASGRVCVWDVVVKLLAVATSTAGVGASGSGGAISRTKAVAELGGGSSSPLTIGYHPFNEVVYVPASSATTTTASSSVVVATSAGPSGTAAVAASSS